MVGLGKICTTLAVLAALVVLTSCASALPRLPKKSEIIGVYSSNDGSSMVLSKDGACELKQIPQWVLEANATPKPRGVGDRVAVIVDCRWTLGAGGQMRSNNGVPLVALDFGKTITLPVIGLVFHFDRPASALYLEFGDPDLHERYTYVKEK